MRVSSPEPTKEPVLSQSVRGRALIAAASLVVLSVSLLEQPERVEAAPVAAVVPEHHAVTVPAFVGPVVAPPFGRSPAVVVEARTEALAASAAVTASRATREASRTVRRVAAHGTAAHRRAHLWLNRLHLAYRYSHTHARRVQLDRAVRIVTARLYRDHVAAARAKAARQAPRGMAAVVAYAMAQVGKRYVSNAAGPNSFDCSGLTMQAYRRIGLRLPHSSLAQAARAYPVSRSRARAGDLVVGPGHVGVYMGGGMMVDAGNPRVGVKYRRMYRGLWIERLR
jgi:cell wall-associated NlpC family hydrolase